jgi:hypothetical protein
MEMIGDEGDEFSLFRKTIPIISIHPLIPFSYTPLCPLTIA